VADCLQAPKIPSILTDSIIIHALCSEKLLPTLPIVSLALGGSLSNIIAVQGDAKPDLFIETKGTNKSELITVGRCDQESDYMIWLKYGDVLISDDPFGNVTALVATDPGHNLDSSWDRQRLTGASFLKAWHGGAGGVIENVVLNLADLLDAH
jgi:hypothetical protein